MAPQSMEFSRQEYWSGLPFPSPEDLPNPGIEPGSPALQADALPSELLGKPLLGEGCEIKFIFWQGKKHLNKNPSLPLGRLTALPVCHVSAFCTDQTSPWAGTPTQP